MHVRVLSNSHAFMRDHAQDESTQPRPLQLSWRPERLLNCGYSREQQHHKERGSNTNTLAHPPRWQVVRSFGQKAATLSSVCRLSSGL